MAPERMWQSFFDSHAPHYEENVFTKNTRFEVEFLIDLFELLPGSHVLDMGCGTGRHAIEFARRGYKVTGVDLSEGMLAEATKNAAAAGVLVDFIHGDAGLFESDILFDAAVCLCEGGVGLAEQSEDPIAHDLAIFKAIYRALRPNAPFALTAMNGYAVIRQMTDELVEQGRFDPASMLSVYEDEWNLPEGKRVMKIRERLLIPPEMVAMLRHAGFTVESVWGGTAGEWGKRPVKLDEVEAFYFCWKR